MIHQLQKKMLDFVLNHHNGYFVVSTSLKQMYLQFYQLQIHY